MTKVELAQPYRVYVKHAEYIDMVSLRDGVCFACGCRFRGPIAVLEKPVAASDASSQSTSSGGHRCRNCQQQAVVGAVQAVLEGWLIADDEKVQARTPS